MDGEQAQTLQKAISTSLSAESQARLVREIAGDDPIPDGIVAYAQAHRLLERLVVTAKALAGGSSQPLQEVSLCLASTDSLGDGAVQAITRRALTIPDTQLWDVNVWRGAMADAERAVCIVRHGTEPRGTGFLIGPDLVLTCAHVVPGMDADEIRLEFDYAKGVPGGGGEFYSCAEIVVQEPDPVADYALLRLDRAVGFERPWLELSRHQFRVGEPLFILQHPNGVLMQLGVGFVQAAMSQFARAMYSTTTSGGSSGGPCFTADWKVVALHSWGQVESRAGIYASLILDRLSARQISLAPSASLTRTPSASDLAARAAQSFAPGLQAFHSVAAESGARATAEAAVAVLTGAERRMRAVIEYKRLHDVLHEVLVRVIEPIGQLLEIGPSERTVAGLAELRAKLGCQYRRAIQIRTRGLFAGGLVGEVVQDLRRSRRALKGQTRRCRDTPEERGPAFQTLSARILPGLESDVLLSSTAVNERLVAVASSLDLDQVVQCLERVHAAAVSTSAGIETLSRLRIGIDDLSTFDTAFRSAIEEHDQWQQMDRLVRGNYDLAKDGDLERLQERWESKIEPRLSELSQAFEDAWAVQLRAALPRMRERLDARDAYGVTAVYEQIVPIVDQRFYDVDQSFLRRCERLVPMADDICRVLSGQ